MKGRTALVKFGRLIPDKVWLKLMYRYKFGKRLNLQNPISFNEKIQWLKLYDHNPTHVQLVDKNKVKQYVESIIGKDHIIPTIGIWSSFDEIDFNTLPDQFVLKCTHDSGGLCICKSKAEFDVSKAKSKIDNSIKRNYFLDYREWPYKSVVPQIIAEPYLQDRIEHELKDYKFFCFNGSVQFFKIDFDRFTKHRANYYDRNLTLLPFGEGDYPRDYTKVIKMPARINEMIDMAEKLAGEEPFVRVDLYYCNGEIYFGEMTFFPASGFGAFTPPEWDEKIGEFLKLPNR